VAHSASILSFDKDAAKVIPPTIAAITSILQSSLSEPMIKSFVFTSSSTACNHPNFAINSILPSTILGPVISPKEVTSTAGFIKGLYEGHTGFATAVLPRSCFLFSYIQVLS
jgi:hypothetical protein